MWIVANRNILIFVGVYGLGRTLLSNHFSKVSSPFYKISLVITQTTISVDGARWTKWMQGYDSGRGMSRIFSCDSLHTQGSWANKPSRSTKNERDTQQSNSSSSDDPEFDNGKPLKSDVPHLAIHITRLTCVNREERLHIFKRLKELHFRPHNQSTKYTCPF